MKAKQIFTEILLELKKENVPSKLIDDAILETANADRASDVEASDDIFSLFTDNLKRKYLLSFTVNILFFFFIYYIFASLIETLQSNQNITRHIKRTA